MGQSGSKKRDISIHYDKWKRVEEGLMYDVMKSDSGEDGQLYHFTLPEQKDPKHQLEIYEERTKLTKNIVDVIGVDLIEQGYGFCGNTRLLRVLTERIPHTLRSIRRLNAEQATIVLYNSLNGFQRLYSQFGFTNVNDGMIGFTSVGQTKVWIQQNFGMNYPCLGTSNTNTEAEKESMMVKNIYEVVESKLQGGKFNQRFRQDFYSNSTFKNASNFIAQSQIVSQEILLRNIIYLSAKPQLTQTKERPVASLVRHENFQPIVTNNTGYVPYNGFGLGNSPKQFIPMNNSAQKSNSKIRFTYDQNFQQGNQNKGNNNPLNFRN